MINKYPLWKYLIIAVVLIAGCIYAMPNLYMPDPAIQISGESSSQKIDDRVLNRVTSILDKAGVKYFDQKISEDGKSVIARFEDDDAQLKAQDALKEGLGLSYITALNRASNTPQWLQDINAGPLKLGLDLSGGVHFLLEVDIDEAVNKNITGFVSSINTDLRKEKLRGSQMNNEGRTIIGVFRGEEVRDKALALIKKNYPLLKLSPQDSESDGKFTHKWTIQDSEINRIQNDAVSQNILTLRKRVNELGVAEPLVQRQGKNRIVVELPGVQDPVQAKRIIGKTANLEFRLEARADAGFGNKERFEFRSKADAGRNAWLERDTITTGDHVINATRGFDESNRPQVNITLDGTGGKAMHRITADNIKRNMGVLFIERKTRMVDGVDENGNPAQVPEKYDEKKIISLATIQSALGVQFRITGLDSPDEAGELALLLRAGALAAPMDFVEERIVGPSMGKENIDNGLRSIIWGLGLVMLFMLIYYKLFGIVANLALVVNLILICAVMSMFSATLTLPGIAGIVLTVGMAVDANVLIFSRIKEELADGSSPHMAIDKGYANAFSSIVDANLTTFIVAMILFAIGSGPIKGFAVTLMIGILTSMFTAIMVSRAIVNLSAGNRPLSKLWI